MFSVTGTTIRITRGDSGTLQVDLKRGNNTYTPVNGDVIRFYLGYKRMNAGRTAYVNAGAIITKTVDINNMLLQFDPADTKNLEFGTYVYDMEMTFADGTVDTFIEGKDFIIAPEVD